MKTIANLGTLQEAQSLKMKLESVGIEAFIPDELTAAIAPHHFLGPSGVRLQVAEEYESEAIEILNIDFSSAEQADSVSHKKRNA